jgi:predicted P-loop ATPase
LSEAIVRAVREKIIAEYRFDPRKENVQEVLDRLCEKNRFDPICDYFDGLKWDGTKRADHWLVDYLGAEDTPLNRAFGRKTLVAAVRRARQPGCKLDTMLVLEGAQGAGKSTAIRILAGDENFSDQPIKWDDHKQQQEAVRGVLIHEISELVGLRKADVESIKSFLSRQSDKCRPAYGRYVEDRPRRCIFIGTTNNGEGVGYLTDPSGARCFWPVAVGHVDLAALARDRDQLWAEAAALEARGEPITLEPNLYEDAHVQQKLRQAEDPWADRLAGVSGEVAYTALGQVERITSEDLLGPRFLDIPLAQANRTHSVRLAAVMRSLGWNGPKVIRLKDEKDRAGRVVRVGRVVKGYDRRVG